MLDLSKPPPHPLVSASILSADFGAIAEECRDVLGRGADLLHIDVMDGHFVPNLTMGPDMVKGLRRHFPDTFLDVHLMVERPDVFVPMFADAGANQISFHIEVCEPMRSGGSGGSGGLIAAQMFDMIRGRGVRAGLAINPDTPGSAIEPFLADADMVLVMSVHPGRSGQKFMPGVLEKTRWIHDHLKPGTRMEIDGGINEQTAPLAAAAGADMMVTASALFGSDDRDRIIRVIHSA